MLGGFLLAMAPMAGAGIPSTGAVDGLISRTVDALGSPAPGVVIAEKPLPLARALPRNATVAAILATIGAAGFVVMLWVWRNKLARMLPYEVALQRLESIQYWADRGRVEDVRDGILNVLGDYVRVQLALPGESGRGEVLLCALLERESPLSELQQHLLQRVLETESERVQENALDRVQMYHLATGFVWATSLDKPERARPWQRLFRKRATVAEA
jgi:hypothetical protein